MTAENHAAALLAEIKRRNRLRDLVHQAGYSPSTGDAWVLRSEVTKAVAALINVGHVSFSLGADLRRFLLAEGWMERRTGKGWQWRAVKAGGAVRRKLRKG